MLRDKLKDELFFQENIKSIEEFFEELFKKGDPVDENHKRRRAFILKKDYFSLFKLSYSLGKSVDEIFEYYKKSLNYYKDLVYEGTGLYSVIDYFALGVLYSDRKEEFIEDLKIMHNNMVNTDDIIEYYWTYLLEGKVIPYHSVFEYQNMIEDSFESVKKAQGFWYASHSDAYWYDSHKRSSYEGYWSFDTAATCKVKDIFDERLKDLEYFPYDLLVQE